MGFSAKIQLLGVAAYRGEPSMEMNVNRELIKELRLKKSWSQGKLADVAGVSMRTIQRVETDGVASLQSRIAIAGALKVEPVDLDLEPAATSDLENEASDGSIEKQRVFEHLKSAWGSFFKPILRFSTLAMLWIGMTLSAFLVLTTLISGIFFWEMTPFSYWQSVGTGIIGASIFVPVFLLFYWLYRRITKRRVVELTNQVPVKG